MTHDNVKVEVLNIGGHDPKFGAWSVDVRCWLMVDGEKKHEKMISKNIPKGQGKMDEDNDGVPDMIHGFKDTYIDMIEKEKSSVSTEEKKANECQGCQYDL